MLTLRISVEHETDGSEARIWRHVNGFAARLMQ